MQFSEFLVNIQFGIGLVPHGGIASIGPDVVRAKERSDFLRLGRSAWQAGQWQLDANKLGELMAGEISVNDIEAGDIYPDIRQKGVDMRLGLDIATIAYKRQAERLVLVANDADYVPAVKLAREEGLKVVLDPLWTRAAEDLREHVDYVCNKLPRPQYANYPHGIHIFDDPKEYTPFTAPEAEETEE